MLIFPSFDPVAFHLGPLAVHWYGLAYVVSLLLGLEGAKMLARRYPAVNLDAEAFENLFIYVVLGVVLGGRIGYVMFYGGPHFWMHPLDIIKVWQGGMSFHGGMLGVAIALTLFAFKAEVSVWDVADRVAPVIPIGLFFGRLANFVNGELWGRVVTDTALPWAMVYPHVDGLLRHPSPLYEAGLEGVLLGLVMLTVVRRKWERGVTTGTFLVGYGLARVLAETFRVPEIVHTWGGVDVTQGQLLSLPMILAGLGILAWVGFRTKRPF